MYNKIGIVHMVQNWVILSGPNEITCFNYKFQVYLLTTDMTPHFANCPYFDQCMKKHNPERFYNTMCPSIFVKESLYSNV